MMATEYGGAPSWEDWSQPRTLGPYRLLEPLGVNAADTVYLARVDGAHRLQRWVALRVVERAGPRAGARAVRSGAARGLHRAPEPDDGLRRRRERRELVGRDRVPARRER